MSWQIVHTSKAESDIWDAAIWCGNQKQQLSQDFLDEILVLEIKLSQHPLIYPVIHSGVRRATIKRFPYAVYFIVRQQMLVIIAVLHIRRSPNLWEKRI